MRGTAWRGAECQHGRTSSTVCAPASSIVLVLFLPCVCLFSASFPALAATWSSELQVHQDDDYDDWSPSIAVDADGVPCIVWMGRDPVQLDEEVYFSRWEGSSWSSRQRLHADNAVSDRFPEIAAGKLDGVLWAVWARWNGGTGKYDFLASRGLGSVWSEPETVFTAGGRYDAYDIVARDTSLVWVVWSTREHSGGAQDREIVARKREKGVWGEVEQVVNPGSDDDVPRVDLDSAGRLWVVWHVLMAGVFSAVRTDTGWTEPLFIKHDPGGSLVPWVAVDDSDVPWIVWAAGNSLGGGDVLSARWQDSVWVELGMVNIPDAPEDEDINPVIVSISGSGPLVLWWGGLPVKPTHRDIYESKWTAYGWRQEACVSTPDSVYLALDERPTAAVGPGGRVWACWMRMGRLAPGDYDIWARYSDDVVPVPVVGSFTAAIQGGSVHLSWVSDDFGSFEVWRSDAESGPGVGGAAATDGAAAQAAGADYGLTIAGKGVCLTRTPIMGQGLLSFEDSGAQAGCGYWYWLVQLLQEGCFTHGPVFIEMPSFGPGLDGVSPRVFPNPVYSTAEIVSAFGSMAEILDLQGRLIRRLAGIEAERDGHALSAFRWDGKDEAGRAVASGVYLLRLLGSDSAARAESISKIVVLR